MTRQQTQRLASALITLTAVFVFVPVIIVIVYLFWQGIGAISWSS